MPASYPFIDVVILDGVRERFAAGEAMVILSADLDEVLWANGAGAALLGHEDIESAMGAGSGLGLAARRQVMATHGYPAIGRDRTVLVRLVQGVVAFHASAIVMPGGEQAILLALPRAAVPDDPARAIEGFADPAYLLAMLDGEGRVLAASPGFAALDLAPAALGGLAAQVQDAPDRLAKRLLPAGARTLPAGIARLLDTPVRSLLLVVDEAQAPAATVGEAPDEAGQPMRFDPHSVALRAPPLPLPGGEETPIASATPFLSPFEGERWIGEAETERGSGVPHASAPPDEAASDEETSVEETPSAGSLAGEAPAEEIRVGEVVADGADEGREAVSQAVPADDGDTPSPAAPLSVPDRNATPLRFMWRTDTAGRFSAVSPDFAAAMGLPVGDLLGRSFRQVSERLGLDPSGEVAALLERRDTWSGRSVLWPVAGTPLKVPVDLAALPIYARDRSFEGFRGFGVARLADAVVGAEAAPAGLAETADEQAAADLPAAANDAAAPHADDPFRGEVPALKIVPTRETPYPDKVIRLAEHRPGPPEPGLSPGERSAFREIGERLRKVEGQAGDDDSTETGEAPVAPKTDAVGTAETLDAPEAVGRADVAAGVDDEAVRPEPAEAEPSASAMLPVSAQPAEAGAEDAEADVAPTPADEAEPLPSEMPALDDPALAPASEQDAVAGAPQTPPETSDLDHWIAPSPTEAEGDADTVGWAETDGATEANGAATADEAETIGADAMHAAETEEADAVGFHFASVPDLPAMDDVAGPSQPAEATISVGPDGEDGDTLAPPADMLAPDAALPDPAGRSHMDLSDEAAQDTTGPSPQEGGERLDADAIQDGSAASGDAAELPSPLSGGVRGGGTPSGAIALPSLADMADGDPADALPADVTLPADAAPAPRQGAGFSEAPILARLPVPVLIHSGDVLHYANPEFLALTGHATLDDLAAAGGLGSLFPDPDGQLLPDAADRSLRMRAADGSEFPIEALLRSVPWEDGHALMLVVRRGDEPAMPAAPSADAARDELRAHLAELRTIIDTATDGVIIIGADGLIRSVSRPAEALFGYESDDVAGKPFVSLFAMESQRAARDYLAGLSDHGVASVLNDGREVIGREAQGRFIPLFLSIGRLPNDGGFCAVVRDITPWKRAEEELTQSRALAERASSQKSEFLARISHEIRTPLNAIIGFSELMIDERFGPVGNERYRDYLRDINKSGNHVLDLVNDLLDISKIEAGEQEMAYEAVSLNDALAQTVAMMQPQANRERVIIRSSFASRLPDVVADLRSVRQIALNLLSNAVRYTQAGGQVIVSTAYEPSGDVVIRVRDTGVGMTSAEIEQAMKPFKQVNALRGGRNDGTGLGLPLTKAMVEANRARFTISSTPGEGTLVEVTFPSTRVLAE